MKKILQILGTSTRLSAVTFVAIFAFGCQKSVSENSSEAASKDHLRSALIALDSGDEASAEKELQLSLSSDPLNGRARTTLASLYANQAGVSLRDWLDPFWNAARQLGGRIKGFQQSTEIVDQVTKDMNGISKADMENLTEEQLKMRERSINLTKGIAKFSLGSSVALDVFQAIPFLSDPQLKKLDQAIGVLREQNLAPADREEEQRVYLSILSFVRLVNHLKRFLGDSNSLNFSSQRERICLLNTSELQHHLGEIRQSLSYLEEGLVVSPKDPQTSQRQARIKFQKFVTDFLTSPAWEHLDNLFDPATAEGISALFLSRIICSSTMN